jgi:hypothetical protein
MITQQLIVNPGFEIQNSPDGSNPSAWTVESPYILMNHTEAYSGQWCASLCGHNISNNQIDTIYQSFTIPANSTASLSYVLQIDDSLTNPDSLLNPSCTLTVEVEDQFSNYTTVATYNIGSPLVGKGWMQQGVYDLSMFAGQTITLIFTSTQRLFNQGITFNIDNVYVSTVLNLPVSSYPPLISNFSQDLLGDIQLYGNNVYCSCLVPAQSTDLFYNPSYAGGLTGFAADGFYYTSGVQNPTLIAPWFSEVTGGGDKTTRGDTQGFPTNALILVTDQSIAILDQVDNMSMWMIFKKGVNNAYSDTFGIVGAAFIPSSVNFSSGVLSVTFSPAPGTGSTALVVLNIDFVKDFIFIDTATT